jgi:3-oxoacyl-[acyl-carrier protein] reductase
MISVSLAGKVALVSGGSRGIGRATAIQLAQAGAKVAIGYQRDEAAAREVVGSIQKAKGTAVAIAAELSVWDQARLLVAKCSDQLGGLDILVVNHGIWKYAPIDRMTESEWDETADINLKGAIGLCRFASERMRAQRRGNLILVSSTAGQRGEAEHAHYAATKGALISLTKSLAAELAKDGIRVNGVAPGWVETDMTRDTLGDSRGRSDIERTIPLGRVGKPDEIANAVLFLASDLSTFVTGEILNVNGGAVLVG